MATSQDFCNWVCDTERLDPAYLMLAFMASQSHLAELGSGAVHKTIYMPAIESFHIYAPPVKRQHLIARDLRDQFELTSQIVETQSQAVEETRVLLSALLRQVFGASPPIVAATPVCRDPVPLVSLARLESGHTPSRRHPEWWGGSVPWLALPDIRKLHGKIAHETKETINVEGLANSSARLLPTGTVCVSRTASIGFVTMLGRPMATSQDFCNWVCDSDRLDPEYLMYAFMASQEHLRDLGSGAVHKTIYMPTIESFHIHAPAIDEQRSIAGRLREQLAAAEALQVRLAERQAEILRLPQRILAAAFGEA